MQTTGNSSNIIKQQIYGEGLQESFKDNLAGLIGVNDLTSEFPEGDTFNVDMLAVPSQLKVVAFASVAFIVTISTLSPLLGMLN